jgi:hypothetical protein
MLFAKRSPLEKSEERDRNHDLDRELQQKVLPGRKAQRFGCAENRSDGYANNEPDDLGFAYGSHGVQSFIGVQTTSVIPPPKGTPCW